jgi:hypothetical protein
MPSVTTSFATVELTRAKKRGRPQKTALGAAALAAGFPSHAELAAMDTRRKAASAAAAAPCNVPVTLPAGCTPHFGAGWDVLDMLAELRRCGWVAEGFIPPSVAKRFTEQAKTFPDPAAAALGMRAFVDAALGGSLFGWCGMEKFCKRAQTAAKGAAELAVKSKAGRATRAPTPCPPGIVAPAFRPDDDLPAALSALRAAGWVCPTLLSSHALRCLADLRPAAAAVRVLHALPAKLAAHPSCTANALTTAMCDAAQAAEKARVDVAGRAGMPVRVGWQQSAMTRPAAAPAAVPLRSDAKRLQAQTQTQQVAHAQMQYGVLVAAQQAAVQQAVVQQAQMQQALLQQAAIQQAQMQQAQMQQAAMQQAAMQQAAMQQMQMQQAWQAQQQRGMMVQYAQHAHAQLQPHFAPALAWGCAALQPAPVPATAAAGVGFHPAGYCHRHPQSGAVQGPFAGASYAAWAASGALPGTLRVWHAAEPEAAGCALTELLLHARSR